MTRKKTEIINSGVNHGAIVAENYGDIYLTLEKRREIPSLIAAIVKYLGAECVGMDDDPGKIPKGFKTDEKISYNAVVRYKEIIENFSVYYDLCNTHLNIYDNAHIKGKARILQCVHIWYMEEKGKILASFKDSKLDNIEIVKQNSDELIDRVKAKIYEAVNHAANSKELYLEDLEIGVICFTCYCFMECKILEKPK